VLALVAVLGTAPAFAAEPLGRLFFAPERRAQLDRQRQTNVREVQVVQGETLSLNGIVRREDGRSTVWINGVPQAGAGAGAISATIVDRARATLAAGEDAPVSLKVGESVNRGTREKADGLHGGSVRVRPTPP
jgi:hypothetical protein